MVSELDDALQSGCYESHLGYDIFDWFTDEVLRLENKMAVYFKNNKKYIILTEKDKKHY